jgi:LacI family transcriptional regulator
LIRERACERVRINEIAALVGVSRSVLQRRFRATLGRTINDELIRQRVKIAQHLLLETNLTLIDVALRSGFQHQEYMGVVFKKVIGMTPDGWRRGG